MTQKHPPRPSHGRSIPRPNRPARSEDPLARGRQACTRRHPAARIRTVTVAIGFALVALVARQCSRQPPHRSRTPTPASRPPAGTSTASIGSTARRTPPRSRTACTWRNPSRSASRSTPSSATGGAATGSPGKGMRQHRHQLVTNSPRPVEIGSRIPNDAQTFVLGEVGEVLYVMPI